MASQLSLNENGKQAPNFESLMRILAVPRCDFHDLYNGLRVAEGKLDRVCSRQTEREEDATAEKIVQGISLLLRAFQKASQQLAPILEG